MNDIIDDTVTIESGALSVAEEQALATVAPAAPPTIQEGPGALLGAIITLARDPSVDVAKLDALLHMQERMEARQAEMEFNRALARLPAMHVRKNGRIDLTKKGEAQTSKPVPFAKWEDIARVIEPMLEAEGFRLMFDSQPRTADGGGLIVTGMLLHRDGHSKTASMPLALDTGPGRNNLQAMGSTLSYGKRYCTEMLLNVVRELDDDDGVTGGAQFIRPDQIAQITALVNETKTDPPEFMRWIFNDAEPHNYGEIPAERFTSVVNALMSKKRRIEKDAAK